MKVKITEYKKPSKGVIAEMPTEIIKSWNESIPKCTSNFRAADYVAAKYPGKILGVII